MMNEIERETTIASLQKLCARLETLRHLDIADLQLPDQQKHYEQTLEDAYTALAQVEAALDGLSQELEFQQQRLGGTGFHRLSRRHAGAQLRWYPSLLPASGTYMPPKWCWPKGGSSASTIEEGVQATTHLIMAPELDQVTERYFNGLRKARAEQLTGLIGP